MTRRNTRVDLHVHTRGSDGFGTPLEIAQAARRAGLHFVALTDHHTNTRDETLAAAEALLDVGVQPILGCEYSTAENHLLIYGVPVELGQFGRYPRMQVVVDWVNAQGGVCICAHPHKGYSRAIRDGVEDVRWLAGVEVLNGQVERDTPRLNQLAISNAARMGVPGTGGSDAHDPEMIGATYTRFSGCLETVGDVLAALRSRRGYMAVRNESVLRREKARWAQVLPFPRAEPARGKTQGQLFPEFYPDYAMPHWSEWPEWVLEERYGQGKGKGRKR